MDPLPLTGLLSGCERLNIHGSHLGPYLLQNGSGMDGDGEFRKGS